MFESMKLNIHGLSKKLILWRNVSVGERGTRVLQSVEATCEVQDVCINSYNRMVRLQLKIDGSIFN